MMDKTQYTIHGSDITKSLQLVRGEVREQGRQLRDRGGGEQRPGEGGHTHAGDQAVARLSVTIRQLKGQFLAD